MRTSQLLLRSGLTVTAAAVLPLALTAGPAGAASGISVSTIGTTVSVTTSACSQNRTTGVWGTGSLLTSSQASFAEGRKATLAGTTVSQSTAWTSVTPGTYTVIVMCQNATTPAGTQTVIVSAAATPRVTATASPSRGVMGGLGGATKDYGPLTLGVGAGLVGTGVIAAAWFLRRRAKPYRL
ncbi:hypothetical protein SAMN05216489_08951 [Streptomyces sp. 3213]|uniref:hypothetical protein n=1 Tax=Streptomyces sp. 3213.3 TaxID=1855348 RepID=UPI000896D823|nr:hypothetical protein [Streptomyces sp. 3213.3]SEE92241.1 hypothetical protein SAMN05216489_08951 [Streptomyces sp. 3213] [Streptomyces sp. 3213.3]